MIIRNKIKQIIRNFTFSTLNKNIEAQLQKNALFSTVEFTESFLLEVESFATKNEVYDHCLENMNLSVKLDYLEFGVYKAKSLNYMAGKHKNLTWRGFDSFEGLPEFWRDGYKQGYFKLKGLPYVLDNVQLYEGWFNETILKYKKESSQKISFLHIDSDLYSSCKDIFTLLSNRITGGTVILFDDYFNYVGWENGEHKAFKEFVKLNGVIFEYIAYNKYGQQLAVRIKCIKGVSE